MLLAKGDTGHHVGEAVAHVRRVAKLIGASRLSELTADAARKAIASVRDSGRSLRTCNSILRSVKTFSGWLQDDRRTRCNDLKPLKGCNQATDRRHARRDLEDDELARLIDAAERGPAAFGMSGVNRATAYRVGAGTGFRRGELRSLTPKSFDLAGDEPSISVTASYSKRRRDDVQPIDGGLADTLRPWLAGKSAGEPLLALPAKTAAMVRSDLRLARAKWLRKATAPLEPRERRQSDFLKAVDAEGRVFDFHSLRHSYISRIVSDGASVKVCQELARHSTPSLTIGRYAHVRIHDLRAAVPSVPGTISTTPPEAVTLRATGTCDSAPHGCNTLDAKQCESMRPGAIGAHDAVIASDQNHSAFAGKRDALQQGAMNYNGERGEDQTNKSPMSSPISTAGAEWVRAPTAMRSTPVIATARTVSRVTPPDASSNT